MELGILNNIIETINAYDFGELDIKAEKAKLDLSSYEAIGNTILVKTLGYRPVNYLDSNMQMTIATKGYFVLLESVWRLILISKDLTEQDDLLEVTELIEGIMKTVPIDEEETREEYIFYLQNVSEPMFEEEKQFYFREMTFVKPILKYIGQ